MHISYWIFIGYLSFRAASEKVEQHERLAKCGLQALIPGQLAAERCRVGGWGVWGTLPYAFAPAIVGKSGLK